MKARESAAAAKAYYTEKARQDYYSEGQEILGNWGGKGAERLGLHGTVESNAFVALCDNLNPITGEPLTPRLRVNRIPGYDLNFHGPKSVSVVYAWNGDRRIVEAFLRAVRETMTELEKEALTRIRKDGHPDGDRLTGELTWAEFLHLTARPEGKFPDPHLHAHCFTFNATFDGVEQQWKAAQFREIMRHAPYYQATFLTRLANNLMAIGYDVRPVAKAFEIAGVPDAVLKQFSKRTMKIKETAERLKITDPRLLDRLGALTRKAKKSDLTFTELRRLWKMEVSDEHRAALDRFLRPHTARQLGQHPLLAPHKATDPIPKRHKASRTPTPLSALTLLGPSGKGPPRPPIVADPSVERKALDRSILHNFYRASVVTELEILTHALRLSYGSALTPEGLREAMKRHLEFIFGEINGRRLVTTHTVLAEERENIQWVKAGKGTLPALVAGYQIRDQKLNDEQQAAVLHVLSSRDRVTAIEGKSGTGKTWLMKEAVAALEAEHLKVLVLAPSTDAVQQTLKKGGFPNAQTVEQLLINEKLQQEYRNGIWWVDEAGMLSGHSMSRLFTLADKLGARVVFTGDVGQHRAVERGDALRMLYDYADLKPAYVTKIMRQTGSYREWMELLAQGKVAEAFEKMDAGGVVHEIPEKLRYKEVAKLYTQRAGEGRRPGVVSPTHAEGALITEAIRAARKAEGELKQDTPIQQLKQIDMSPAEQGDWRTYRPGWVLEFFRATPGIQAGTRLVIDSIDYEAGQIYLKVPVGATQMATRALDVEKYQDRFAVYEAAEINIAPGERIRITKNGPAVYGRSKVFRGSEYTFTGFDEHGDLKLDNGMVIKRDCAHLAYGYVSTSLGAQSKTVDHVIVVESAVSYAAASREQWYVSTGRGKKRLDIVTGNKVELLEAVLPSSRRHSAMELVEPKPETNPLPEDYREELRKAQERAEAALRPKEGTRRQLGQHRTLPTPTPAPAPTTKLEPEKTPEPPHPKAVPVKTQLGRQPKVGEPTIIEPVWRMPVRMPPAEPAKPEPLHRQLGEQPTLPKPERAEPLWRMPAKMPPVEPEPKKPDLEEDLEPPMLPGM
jgi:conjugative relaxase-like TrwC/TraI family protein